MQLGKIYLVVLFGLLIAACDKQPYLDREFSTSTRAYTNVFELMADYEKQTDASGQADGVRVIRYYEKNHRYAGYTNQARTWFRLITEDDIKQRIIKRIERRSGPGTANPDAIFGPVRVVDGVGFYQRVGPCHFISVLKRVTGPNKADNDTGDPDFIGVFRICRR